MRRLFLTILILGLTAPLIAANAQEPVREPLEIGESGDEYLRSIRLHGIDPDVAYYDPTAPAPKLETEQQPQQPTARSETESVMAPGSRWTFTLIAGLVLAGLAFLVIRFGGNIAVTLQRDAENPDSRRAAGPQNTPVWAEKLGSFNDIMRIADRREALVMLTQKVLATLATTNGVLMQRSWTARDTLRNIPLADAQQTLLRTLVLNSERVQFGGRDVSEDEFREHVSSCQQLLGASAA
ncbi:DUF4129 domain-containing protein [Roseibium sp. MMSF_3412]|uniref:DUF4129 domain-containing protein n=1 Tax=Roseibium sp. MMSF_3412 TaxID=3046712 RepID=UPI00273F1639|nr:DUF4129 domain-containing protein [Roseibium sp. MMSF_3412]